MGCQPVFVSPTVCKKIHNESSIIFYSWHIAAPTENSFVLFKNFQISDFGVSSTVTHPLKYIKKVQSLHLKRGVVLLYWSNHKSEVKKN